MPDSHLPCSADMPSDAWKWQDDGGVRGCVLVIYLVMHEDMLSLAVTFISLSGREDL